MRKQRRSTRRSARAKEISARRRQGIAVSYSPVQYKALFEEAADAIVLFDPGTLAIINFNDEACNRLGYSHKEFAKLKISDFEVIESAREIKKHALAIKPGKIDLFETRQKTKNGDILDIEVRAKTINLDGKSLIQAIWRDITARKKIEERLRKSENLLEQTERISLVGGWEYDVLAKRNTWTDGTYRIHGVSKDKFDPNNFAKVFSFYPPEDSRRLTEAFAAAIQEGRPYDLKLQFRPADGRHRYVRVIGQAERKADKIVCVFGNIMDITAHVHAERQLFYTNQRLNALMHAATVGICFSDDSTCRRITGNPALMTQFEINPGDNISASASDPKAAGRQVRYFHEGRELSASELPLQRAVAEGRIVRPLEVEILMPGGRRWIAEVSGAPIHDSQGSISGGIAVTVDITDRKQAEQKLRDMAAELERRVEERTASLTESMGRLETLQGIISRGPVVLILWRAIQDNWPIEMVSDNVSAVFGYTAEDFTSGRLSWMSITSPEDLPRLSSEASRYLEQDIPEWSQEYRVITKSGKIRWIRDWNRTIKDASGTITHIQALLMDVTERKRSEIELEQSNRALRVLSHSDRALFRASSEQELLNEACRIISEDCGHRAAWIGYALRDARKTIRPMAGIGDMNGFLSRTIRTWAGGKADRCTAGAVIRTGAPCVCRNLSRNPPSWLSRKAILKYGLKSVLLLPLPAEQGCLGVLTIFSDQSDAFDDTEVKLIQQLSHDLSFGIMAIHDRVERSKLERQALDISEREQRRLGQDLHDGVGQSIIGIKYLISAVQQDLAEKAAPEAVELERITRLVEKTIREAHDLAQGLFPGELRRGGIADALHSLAIRTQSIFGIPCRCTSFPGIKLDDANIASQLYRIAQEAMHNAAKHSKGKKIDICLSRKNGSLMLRVRDRGIGQSPAVGRSAGMGQRIMKYRADMIGATLKIESVRGKGTTVTCVLPLERTPREIPT